MIIAGYCHVDGLAYNVLVVRETDLAAGLNYCSARCRKRMKKRRNTEARRALGCLMGCPGPAADGQGHPRMPLCALCLLTLACSCRGKVRYRRRRDADLVAPKFAGGPAAYLCFVCDHWHLGNRPAGGQVGAERIALMLRRLVPFDQVQLLARTWAPEAGAQRPRRVKVGAP